MYILPNIEFKIKNFWCKRKILETEQKLESATGGGYAVLENFSIIKGCPENAYLLHRFSKNATRFLEKTKLPRKRRANFFWPRGSKTLVICTYVYACFPPFTGVRGQLGQSCKGKSCMRFAWQLFEMNLVMVGALDEFLKGFWPRRWPI